MMNQTTLTRLMELAHAAKVAYQQKGDKRSHAAYIKAMDRVEDCRVSMWKS